jgi:hypothetical protein
MKKTRYTCTMFRLMLTVVGCGLLAQAETAINPYPGVLTTPVDNNTTVRFFRVADPNDERMKVAPVLAEGRTVHISLSEMQDLVAGMTRSILMGQQTRGIEVLEPWEMIPTTETMDVVLIFSKGAARGAILRRNICKTLGSLDSAIKTPRAYWEFQRFRSYYECRVSGFDDAKYSDK